MSEQNSLREEARQQQREALKGKSLGKKISYILYYYKYYIIVGLIIIFAVKSLVSNIVNHKTDALQVVLVNSNKEVDYQTYINEFFEKSGLDDSTYQMSIDPDYVMQNGSLDYTLEQKFFLATASGQVDVVIAPKSFFDVYAKMGYMMDLSTVLSSEELAGLGDLLYTVKLDEDHGGGEELSGIEIENMPALLKGKWYPDCDEPVYYGIPIESKNTEQALEFLSYIQQ